MKTHDNEVNQLKTQTLGKYPYHDWSTRTSTQDQHVPLTPNLCVWCMTSYNHQATQRLLNCSAFSDKPKTAALDIERLLKIISEPLCGPTSVALTKQQPSYGY